MLGVLGEGDGVVGVDDVVAAGTHELGVLGEGAGELNVRVRVVGVGVDVLGVLSVAVVISGTRAEDVAVGVGGVIFGVGAVLGVGLVGVVAPVVEVGLGVGVADAFLPRLGFIDVGSGGGPRADDADVLDADARVEVGAEVGVPRIDVDGVEVVRGGIGLGGLELGVLVAVAVAATLTSPKIDRLRTDGASHTREMARHLRRPHPPTTFLVHLLHRHVRLAHDTYAALLLLRVILKVVRCRAEPHELHVQRVHNGPVDNIVVLVRG